MVLLTVFNVFLFCFVFVSFFLSFLVFLALWYPSALPVNGQTRLAAKLVLENSDLKSLVRSWSVEMLLL